MQSGIGSADGCWFSQCDRSNAIASCVARSGIRVSFSFRSEFWSIMVRLDHYKVCARTNALKEIGKLRAKAGKHSEVCGRNLQSVGPPVSKEPTPNLCVN